MTLNILYDSKKLHCAIPIVALHAESFGTGAREKDYSFFFGHFVVGGDVAHLTVHRLYILLRRYPGEGGAEGKLGV